MPQKNNIEHRRYGRLVVDAFVGSRRVGKQSKRFWRCRCDCGASVDLPYSALSTGNTRSCGCLGREANIKHGAYRDPTYGVWSAMHQRCRATSAPAFKGYGGRGITVCERWRDYKNFAADLGPRPTGGTLERIDVNGNYEPSNCRWASAKDQANNRRNNRRITHNGVTKTVAEWARDLGVSRVSVLYRLAAGWSVEETITIPFNRVENSARTRARRLLSQK